MTQYFIQNESAGFVGNSPLWWPKNNSGYTDRIDDAKTFTSEESMSLIDGCRGSHRLTRWEKDKVLAVAYRTVDIQQLRK